MNNPTDGTMPYWCDPDVIEEDPAHCAAMAGLDEFLRRSGTPPPENLIDLWLAFGDIEPCTDRRRENRRLRCRALLAEIARLE